MSDKQTIKEKTNKTLSDTVNTNEYSSEIPQRSSIKIENNNSINQNKIIITNNNNNNNTSPSTSIRSSSPSPVAKVKLPNFNDVFKQSTTRPSSPLQHMLSSTSSSAKSLTPQIQERGHSPTQITSYPSLPTAPMFPIQQFQVLKPSPEFDNQRSGSPIPVQDHSQQQQQQPIFSHHLNQQYSFASPNDGSSGGSTSTSNSPNLPPTSLNSYKIQHIDRPNSRLRYQSDPSLDSSPLRGSSLSSTNNNNIISFPTSVSASSPAILSTSAFQQQQQQQQHQSNNQGQITPMAGCSPSLTPTSGSPSLLPHHSIPTSNPAGPYQQQQQQQQQQQTFLLSPQQQQQISHQLPPQPTQVIHYTTHSQPAPVANHVSVQVIPYSSYPPADGYYNSVAPPPPLPPPPPPPLTQQQQQQQQQSQHRHTVSYYQPPTHPQYPAHQQQYVPSHTIVTQGAPVYQNVIHSHQYIPQQTTTQFHPHHPHQQQYQNIQIYPVKTASAWSPEEDKLLRMLKEDRKLGWREISSYFPSRTLNACQFRWRRIVIGVAGGDGKNKSKSDSTSRSNSSDNHRISTSHSTGSLSDMSDKHEDDDEETNGKVVSDGYSRVHFHNPSDSNLNVEHLDKSRKLSEEESSFTNREPIYHETTESRRRDKRVGDDDDEEEEEEELKKSLIMEKRQSEESVLKSDFEVPAVQKSNKKSLDHLLN